LGKRLAIFGLQIAFDKISNGTIPINYFYFNTEPQKYGLPDSLVFTIDVKV